MWHPSPEDLARLLDEPPTAAEATHLADCAECAAELDAMRAEHDALGALPRILPVPTSWEAMRHRLEREDLLAGGALRRRPLWMPGIAAALALFLAGGATGFIIASEPAARDVADRTGPPLPSVAARSQDSTPSWSSREAQDPPRVGISGQPYAPDAQASEAAARPGAIAESARTPPVRLATQEPTAERETELPSLYGTPAGGSPNWNAIARNVSRARTPDEAARYVRDVEGAYVAAMTRLAELTDNSAADPAVRLTTLDGIVVTTGAALQRSPADPVINGYHLAARAQRDALLKTVSSRPDQDPWY